jgi:hypothetical protein
MGTFPKVPPLYLEMNFSALKRWHFGDQFLFTKHLDFFPIQLILILY